MVSNRFEEFNAELDQCNWYMFSVEMQKIFVIITVNAQQSTFIQGFANVLCIRQTFKTVRDSRYVFGMVRNQLEIICDIFISTVQNV